MPVAIFQNLLAEEVRKEMKIASSDQSFIDYTILKFGVRVRRSSCHTIVRTDAGWEEYGQPVRLPAPPPMIDPSRSEDLGDLVGNVIEYERLAGKYGDEDSRELRELLLGIIDFETAVGRVPKQPWISDGGLFQ